MRWYVFVPTPTFATRPELRAVMMRYLAVLLLAVCPLFLVLPAGGQEAPALKPVNLPFNTDKDEDDPHVSSSHLTLFYIGNANKKLEVMSATRKNVKDAWSAGKPISELKSKEADFRSPFLSPDDKFPQYLYYSSNKDPEKRDRKGDNYDIYFLVKPNATAEFSFDNAVISVGTEVDEMHPWLTADNQHIYFSRKTEGGWRQFVASRPKDGGQFGEPVRINLPLGYHHATLTPDGKTMYLQGPVESKTRRQRWGLFVSHHDGKNWSRPEPLEGLNQTVTALGEMSPSLSRDGTVLYFVSDRVGGKGGLDVWMIPTGELKK